MHDPLTQAFDIKSPFRGRPSKFWPQGYRNSLVTIWHRDPENFCNGMVHRRDDDSCGWFTPPYTEEARDRILKLGTDQYSTIFNKQHATAEGKDYAYICYEATAYDAIYWTWRAIKHAESKRSGWQYGKPLTPAELDHIYSLDANPVDNLRVTVGGVKDAETCAHFFLTVYASYLRFNRPWYRHPRWHFWHWEFQIHPWQTFRRWAFSRCAGCGRGFSWGYSPTSHSWDSKKPRFLRGEEGLYHSECSSMTMKLHGEPTAGSA